MTSAKALTISLNNVSEVAGPKVRSSVLVQNFCSGRASCYSHNVAAAAPNITSPTITTKAGGVREGGQRMNCLCMLFSFLPGRKRKSCPEEFLVCLPRCKGGGEVTMCQREMCLSWLARFTYWDTYNWASVSREVMQWLWVGPEAYSHLPAGVDIYTGHLFNRPGRSLWWKEMLRHVQISDFTTQISKASFFSKISWADHSSLILLWLNKWLE